MGRNNQQFRIFKFWTLVVDAERIGITSTADNDPRVTKVGKFLSLYKLDGIPQLINMLKDEMRIVGPKPEFPSEVEKYDANERRVLLVRPGVTE